MAVRTANFISAFLQVVDPKEIFPGLIYRFEVLTKEGAQTKNWKKNKKCNAQKERLKFDYT